MPTVFIPTPLRKLSGGIATVETPAATIADIVAELDRRFPGMRDAIIEDDALRPGVVAAINGETTSWLLERVPDGAEVHFLLAISEGKVEPCVRLAILPPLEANPCMAAP